MGKAVSAQRDYDQELNDAGKADSKKYAYSFDFDVMHPYMIRSFEPFFVSGSLLELGSYKGQFTRRFLDRFDDITCVEASAEAIDVARNKLGDRVTLINALFEDVAVSYKHLTLPTKRIV